MLPEHFCRKQQLPALQNLPSQGSGTLNGALRLRRQAPPLEATWPRLPATVQNALYQFPAFPYIAICLEIQLKILDNLYMVYDRDLRLRAIKYTEEGHSLAQAAAVFKVNIGTLIGWRK